MIEISISRCVLLSLAVWWVAVPSLVLGQSRIETARQSDDPASGASGALPEAEEQTAEQEIRELITVTAESGYQATKTTSATRLAAALDEIPLNIQVIPEDVVEDFQLTSQRDALQFHAAVDDKRVRGFNTSEFFRNGFVHLSDVPGYTLERLEIVRGPTAVLNGPVTPGGAVNLITKKARPGTMSFELGGYWGFSGGDRDNRGINADLNFGNIGREYQHGSLAAFRLVTGFQDDTGFGTSVDNESISILPTLRLQPTATTFISLEYYDYEINTDRTDRPMGVELTIPGASAGEQVPLALAYGIDPRSTWFGPDTDIEESLSDISASLTQILSDRFFFDLEYNDHGRDFVFGPGNRPRIDIFYRLVPRDGAPAGSADPDDYLIRRLTEELSLENDIEQWSGIFTFLPGSRDKLGDHKLVFGADIYDQDQDLRIRRPREAGGSGFFFEFFDPGNIGGEDLRFNPGGAPVAFSPVLERLRTIEQQNVFVNYHGTFAAERLNLLLGLYRSSIEITQTNLRATPVLTETISDNDELLIQAGLVYRFDDRFAAYANLSESQLPDLNNPDFSIAPPVRLGESLEAGLKYALWDSKLTGALGYFSIDEDLDGETFRRAEADGWELDAFLKPSPRWSLAGSFAHADTEVLDSSDPADIGDPLVDEVPNKGALWGRYNFSEDARGGGLAIGGGLVWTGRRVRPTAAAAQSVLELDGRVLRYEPVTRLDLFASYTLPVGDTLLELSLNLRNLTEEENLSNVVPRVPLQGGIQANGDPYVFDGDMEVMLGLRVRR